MFHTKFWNLNAIFSSDDKSSYTWSALIVNIPFSFLIFLQKKDSKKAKKPREKERMERRKMEKRERMERRKKTSHR